MKKFFCILFLMVLSQMATAQLAGAPVLRADMVGGVLCNINLDTQGANWTNYEWYYSTNSNWTRTQSGSAFEGAFFLVKSATYYSWNMFALPTGYYYVAARGFNEGGAYGQWSNELPCLRIRN